MLDQLIVVMVIAAIVTATEVVAAVERPPWRIRAQGVMFLVAGSVGGILLFDTLGVLWGKLEIKPLLVVPTATGLVGMAVGVLFFDFLAYWLHRFLHRFAWPVHALHHSTKDLCAATNYAHFTEGGIRFLVFIVPLSLVQFKFEAIPYLLVTMRSGLEFYIHSPTRAHLGPLTWVFVDNRFHRIHHSVEGRHFDKNFGILFSFWDRMFGTAYQPGAEWPATGVVGVAPPRGLLDYLVFPVRRFAKSSIFRRNPLKDRTSRGL